MRTSQSLRTTTLNINSADRESGTPGSYRIILPKKLQKVKTCTFKGATFPTSFPQIGPGTSVIAWNDNGGVDRTITLTYGSYTATDLCTEIENQMNAVSGPGTYTVTFNPVDELVTIALAVAGNTTMYFADQTDLGLVLILGFLEQDYPFTFAAPLVAPNKYHGLSGNTRIYIRVKQFATLLKDFIATDPELNNEVIAWLPVTNYGTGTDVINYAPNYENQITFVYDSARDIQALDVQFIMKIGTEWRIVDFYGHDTTMNFEIQYIDT